GVGLIDSMVATDPHTIVMTYRTPYFHALDLSLQNLWPYPAHLLAEPFAGDQDAFINLPYWTTQYVHLGPFRVVDYGLGEQQVFERFDGYFLGRPKVDRIVIRSIPDSDAFIANFRAGALDVAPEKTVFTELILQLRDEWKQTGAGTVYMRPENWRYAFVQMNTDWGLPPELSRDARIRQGLYRAMDRAGLREWALPGIPNTDADSFMPKNDPRAPAVGQPFARYPYDQTQALRDLADAGWSRAADGRMLNRSGEPVQINLRASVLDTKEVSVMSDYWRQLGIDMVEQIYPPALSQDREYRAKSPGLEIQSRGSGDDVLDNLYSSNRPLPENRYVGSNPSGYNSPAFDRLYDQLTSTIDQGQQGSLIRDMGDILATDMPVLPTYFRVQMALVPKGVHALEDYAGTTLARGSARSSYLWDKD
ncbi:MAG TPA: ABC transporter substrate-binding protein, partial [Chloroflexota bacterium]